MHHQHIVDQYKTLIGLLGFWFGLSLQLCDRGGHGRGLEWGFLVVKYLILLFVELDSAKI